MTKPLILRITRPYESVEDYIESEGWTISSKRMILLDQPRLDRDTIVRFELSLQTGEKLIRAEARVVGYQAPTPDKPGGPKVRFKRFGGTTKTFIQQVVAEHGPGPGLETVHPSSPDSANGAPSDAPMSFRFSDPVAAGAAVDVLAPGSAPLNLEALGLGGVPEAPVSVREPRSTDAVSAPVVNGNGRQRLRELLQRSPSVTTPENRDALLDKLRQRARGLASGDSMSSS